MMQYIDNGSYTWGPDSLKIKKQLLLPEPIVEIEFRTKGLHNIQRQEFISPLSEQQNELNRLSTFTPVDLSTNLAMFHSNNRARKIFRNILLGDGDAAHFLDAVAGGHIYNFAGKRPSYIQ
jgi:hypothetical protein